MLGLLLPSRVIAALLRMPLDEPCPLVRRMVQTPVIVGPRRVTAFAVVGGHQARLVVGFIHPVLVRVLPLSGPVPPSMGCVVVTALTPFTRPRSMQERVRRPV